MDGKAERWASLVENDEERLEEDVAVDLEAATLVGLDSAEAHCNYDLVSMSSSRDGQGGLGTYHLLRWWCWFPPWKS